jgi:hypothetical protein
VQDEEGSISFNYTEYGKGYPGKLVIYLRHPVDIGQNFTITISQSIPAPAEMPKTYQKPIDPRLFANCSHLSLTVSLPENYVVTQAHPQPTVQTAHKVVWTHNDIVAYTRIEDTLTIKFKESTIGLVPEYVYLVVGIVAIITVGSIVLIMRRLKRKTNLD